MNKKIICIVFIIFTLMWMAVIFKLSSMTSNNSNTKSTDIISVFIEDTLEITNEYGITNSHPNDEKLGKASTLINAPLRKVIHATVYFILAFFIITVMSILFNGKKYYLLMFISLLICIVFALTDEYHQTFVNGRTGQIIDVIIDTAGAVVGAIFHVSYYLVYRHRLQKRLYAK